MHAVNAEVFFRPNEMIEKLVNPSCQMKKYKGKEGGERASAVM
jgi:hypothetical protein